MPINVWFKIAKEKAANEKLIKEINDQIFARKLEE